MSERDLRRLLELVEKHLGSSWVDAVKWLRELPANQVAEIEARLIRGDYGGIVQGLEASAKKFAAEMQNGYVTAGRAGADWLDNKVPDKLVMFDQTNWRAVDRAKRNEYQLIQQVTQDQRDMVRGVVSEGQTAGTNPRELAKTIRDGIGLTANQEQHVRNYRQALEQGDWGNALGRELRDGRSDRTLRKLRDNGGALSGDQVDSLVNRYRANYVALRAETIARSEGTRNVHEGLDESMRQAVERGDVKAEQLVEQWIAGPATRYSREQHQSMDGQQQPFGQPFVAPDGTRIRYPGDPMAGAAHTANCRCTKATTLAA